MREAWTGSLIGRMHVEEVTMEQLANEMNCTKRYVSRILNGTRKPPNARERLESAFENILRRRAADPDPTT